MERIFVVIVLGLCSFKLLAGPEMVAGVATTAPSSSQASLTHNDGRDDR